FLPGSAQVQAPAAGVLNRRIKIVRVERSDSVTGITLKVEARSQVGERQLDAAAAAMCVQVFTFDVSGRPVLKPDPIWMKIPAWDNFSTKTFVARIPENPSRFAGYVVRTYYRKQLEDVVAAPQSLLALAPAPAF